MTVDFTTTQQKVVFTDTDGAVTFTAASAPVVFTAAISGPQGPAGADGAGGGTVFPEYIYQVVTPDPFLGVYTSTPAGTVTLLAAVDPTWSTVVDGTLWFFRNGNTLRRANVATKAFDVVDQPSAGQCVVAIQTLEANFSNYSAGLLKVTTGPDINPASRINIQGEAVYTGKSTLNGKLSSLNAYYNIDELAQIVDNFDFTDPFPAYDSAQGGTVTQTTSKSTGVTINKRCGTITTHDESMTPNLRKHFVVTNSTVSHLDTVVLSLQYDGAHLDYFYHEVRVVYVYDGEFCIQVWNYDTSNTMSVPLIINFAVIAGDN